MKKRKIVQEELYSSSHNTSQKDQKRTESKDPLHAKPLNIQVTNQLWSKQDSNQSRKEDENLRSNDMLDTEWIEFHLTYRIPHDFLKGYVLYIFFEK